MTASFVVFVLIWTSFLGACCGGFAGVVEYRSLARVSLMRRSQCPNCDAALKLWEILPIVGWFLVRGRCRTCGAPISPRELVVEARSTALFFAATVVALLTSDAELAALRRVWLGIGVAALTVGIGVARRVARQGGATPKRACAVGALLALANFAATPLNPLASILRLPGFAPARDAVLSLIVMSAICANAVVLALTVAFELDLRGKFNAAREDASSSK